MADIADRLSPDLIRRLIVRAADPGRRVTPPSQFMASVQTMPFSSLFCSMAAATTRVTPMP